MKKTIFSKLLAILLLCIMQIAVFAQEREVTGTVTDAEGIPLPGVSIQIKGTTQGTITDFDGNYTITVPEDATLIYSYIGFVTQEVPVGDQTEIPIILREDIMELEEIVVMGYGVTKKSDVTGAMSSLKEDDFNKGMTVTPEQMMQGRIPGVQITSNNGEPGSGMRVEIRGANSIRSNTMPLYVIDGVPLDIQNTSPDGATAAGINTAASATNPLNFLNSSDIESIDILKDASASAIYGARGANGVVIITTKKGKEGKSSVGYSTYGSISVLPKKIEVLSAEEWVRYRLDSIPNVDTTQHLGYDTDWQDEVFRTAYSQSHNLSLTGGTSNTQYRASFGYLDQEGIIKRSDLKRYTGRINITQTALKDRLHIEGNLTASQIEESRVPIGSTTGYEGGLLTNTIQANPTMPVYTDTGTYYQPEALSKRNPIAMLYLTDDKTKTNRILGNINANLTIFKGLTYKVNFGVDNSVAVRRIDQSRQLNYLANIGGQGVGGSASINNRELQSWLIEHTLQYNNTIADVHNISFLAGFSYQNFLIRGYNIYTVGYSSDEIQYSNDIDGSDITQSSPSSYALKNELQSFFGRLNYNLMEKYLLTATFRRDGSTKFGENNKYGNFPSIALAWRASQEEFIQNLNVFSNLKFRFGWGLTGNQEIGEKYSLFSLGTSTGSKGVMDGTSVIPGYVLLRTPSPDIRWESTTQTNIGLDMAFFKGRVSATIDLFQKKTTDMLFEINSKQPAPTATQMANIEGSIINKGIEIGLTGYLFDKTDFGWIMDVNFTAIQNTVQDLPVTQITTGSASGPGMTGVRVQVIRNDEPLNSFYGPKFVGFNDVGESLFKGENGNDTTSSSYRQILGSPLPKFTFGINNSFRYKDFTLSFFIQGVQGNKIFNNTANVIGTIPNIFIGNNTFPSVLELNESTSNSTVFSDRFIEDGSYIRLSTLNLTYKVPLKNTTWFSALNVYLTGSNLFVITNYSGYDPDVNTDANVDRVASIGIDNTNYPKARTYTLGLNVTF